MGEVDTKPFESVQAALSLFEEKSDQRKHRSTSTEVKDSAYKQALLKLDIYQQVVDEISTKLKNSEATREKSYEECAETSVGSYANNLESKIKDLTEQLEESEKAKEQLLYALEKSKATEEELAAAQQELKAIKELKLAVTIHAEQMEFAASAEKEKNKELAERIKELNEAVVLLNEAAGEAEREKFMMLTDLDDLEDMRKQVGIIYELENQIAAKALLIASLNSELDEVKESHSASLQAASDAVNEIHKLRLEMELSKGVNIDKEMETELNQFKSELENANEEVIRLSGVVEMLTDEMNHLKREMHDIREKESATQVEIAMLKSETHSGRSKILEAVAGEAKANSVQAGIYRAALQLAIEADAAKKETRRLQQGNSFAFHSQFDDSSQDLQVTTPRLTKLVSFTEEGRDGFDPQIMISMLEYESLIRKAEKADQTAIFPTQVALNLIAYDSDSDYVMLKKVLEASMAEIDKLKQFSEKAVQRAEMAERAKEGVEDQLRKWREQKQRRRVALASFRNERMQKESNPARLDKITSMYEAMPLGKVLNMKI
ncbi:WEB family protein At1g12150-like [Papaver somniferum]|uniref:WEB family protein At1g12150-like n=1 Tax=Papaver somniferum TaxID=3469 RepID=UPI000E6F7A02|nr:WEB family protein At1g12150-like [Papaver somniferum]